MLNKAWKYALKKGGSEEKDEGAVHPSERPYSSGRTKRRK
jgi:hypothetical protein